MSQPQNCIAVLRTKALTNSSLELLLKLQISRERAYQCTCKKQLFVPVLKAFLHGRSNTDGLHLFEGHLHFMQHFYGPC